MKVLKNNLAKNDIFCNFRIWAVHLYTPVKIRTYYGIPLFVRPSTPRTYVLPNCRLEITKKSFFPSTTLDWNNLSPEIRNSGNINIFKRKIKILLEKCLFISVGVIEN
jgi:hypothetical protein